MILADEHLLLDDLNDLHKSTEAVYSVQPDASSLSYIVALNLAFAAGRRLRLPGFEEGEGVSEGLLNASGTWREEGDMDLGALKA